MKTIAIVGAGIAGLGAAYALQVAGCKVIVLEQAEQVGGRIQTHSSNGFTWDPGAQFLLNKFHETEKLLQKLGITKKILIPSTMGTIVPSHQIHYFAMNQPLSLITYPGLSFREYLQLLRIYKEVLRHWRSLDFPWMDLITTLDNGVDLEDWGSRHFSTRIVNELLGLYSSTFFLWTNRETPWWFPLTFVKMMLNNRMYVLQGGMAKLPMELGKHLDVYLQHTVTRVDVTDDDKVTLRVQSPLGRQDVVVDRVILAVPAPVALAMLPNPPQVLGPIRADFLRSAQYTRTISLAVGFNRPIEQNAYGIAIPMSYRMKIAAIGWEHMKAHWRAPQSAGLAVLTTTHAQANVLWSDTNDIIADALLADLNVIYPDAQRHYLFHRVQRFPFATPIMIPGRTRELKRAIEVGPKPHSPIFVCGDYWLGPDIEQALISGYRAAKEVLLSLDYQVPPSLQL